MREGVENFGGTDAEKRAATLAALRAALAEKFPQPPARASGALAVPLRRGESGESEENAEEGEDEEGRGEPDVALPRGAVTEAWGSSGSGALFLEALLDAVRAARGMMALVDGAGAFDPAGGEARLRGLLWVLCKEARVALRAADLLLRDGNLPLVVLDLQMNPAAELRRIPSTTWYRFQRIVEQSTAAFVVLTPRPMVGGAAERLRLHGRWSLHALRRRRGALRLRVERVRRVAGVPAAARQIA